MYHRYGSALLLGATPAARHDFLMRYMSDTERRQMIQRRAERIKWLRMFNPGELPIALRGTAA